jgi:hypothetical protein
MRVDLRAASTAMDLSEIAIGMGNKLEGRLVQRIRMEIERRVFRDYIDNHDTEEFRWWKFRSNWNGVCNGGVGAAFLLLEPDLERLATALEIVLEGLQVFIDAAFLEDGASGEGTGYWMYGLSNFICFSEMLRIRTQGRLDLLDNQRLTNIARYPLGVALSPGRYFPYSDCNEETSLRPGLVTRLAQRTGAQELTALLAEPASLSGGRRFHEAWRDALWWDGDRPAAPALENTYLPASGITRLTSETESGAHVVLSAKAGHNGVSHNHNDVGTFVLHVDGETFLCDPERGVYDNYVRQGRYNVIFANSFGHSLPLIAEILQSEGPEFAGSVTRFEPDNDPMLAEMEIQGAYNVEGLEKAARSFAVSGGEIVLTDAFTFGGGGLSVEEGLVTWLKTMVQGKDAYIVGSRHVIKLSIEAPEGATFELAVLERESEENNKPVPLKRLSFHVSAGAATRARVRIKVLG